MLKIKCWKIPNSERKPFKTVALELEINQTRHFKVFDELKIGTEVTISGRPPKDGVIELANGKMVLIENGRVSWTGTMDQYLKR